jgi:hypothetical protein
MIPADFKVEIEDAALAWQDVTEKLRSCTDGTSGESQVIPTVSLTFAADVDAEFVTLLNPQLNRSRARIRVTDGDLVSYYLLEKQSGNVVKNHRYPTVSGRAYAGVLDNWRPVSHDWPMDMAASAIAAQVAHQDITNQSGATIGVIWQATLDPTIPGGRHTVSKKRRRDIINEIAEACAACVRTTADGLSLEVYDRPTRALTESASRAYTNALSLTYDFDRVDDPANAIRVQGEVIDYTRPTLPVIKVQVIPGAIDADGEALATARAQVFDSTGRPVQHKALCDEAITAGSYTEIPVSGCFSVQGVWLNSGTQEAPVKGAKITPSTVTASIITVPTQATQLFIVSYTQAEQVSWSSALVTNEIIGEAHNTTGTLAVSTTQPIGSIQGVYRASDTNRTGTNFYTGGSATPNTTAITLGISPGPGGTAVVIDYDEYEASASVNLSPSTSLCASDGFAKTTVGAGTTVGLVYIIASALGQEGRATLSLKGSAVGSLKATADPATIRAQQGPRVRESLYTNEGTEVEAYDDSFKAVSVDNLISSVLSVNVGDVGNATLVRWENDTDAGTYKIIIMTPGWIGTAASATYNGREIINEEDQNSTITAIVTQADGSNVTDGTEVRFTLVGRSNEATLSAASADTSAGEASVALTAGGVAEFRVRVVAGPFIAYVEISVVDHPLDAEQSENHYVDGEYSQGWSWDGLENGEYRKEIDGKKKICKQLPKDGSEADGSITGRRQIVDCEGLPMPFKLVEMCGTLYTTDAAGWFSFTCGTAGSNEITVDGISASFTIDPAGAETRQADGVIGGEMTYEVCRDAE